MKVVLDTNVVVSAILTPDGPCARIIDMVVEGYFQPCIDERILAEYERVLKSRRLGFKSLQVDPFLKLMQSVAEPVTAMPLPVDLPDRNDLPFLETAATGRALLVTGNRRHFPERSCKGVMVVSPAELLDIMRKLKVEDT